MGEFGKEIQNMLEQVTPEAVATLSQEELAELKELLHKIQVSLEEKEA